LFNSTLFYDWTAVTVCTIAHISTCLAGLRDISTEIFPPATLPTEKVFSAVYTRARVGFTLCKL
jgi:hypothetical protein